MEKQQKKNLVTTKTDDKLLSVKKVVHRKPPVIKQTLTSMYRIAKANPLLVFKDKKTEEQLEDYGVSNIKLPKSILQPPIHHLVDNEKSTIANGHSAFNPDSKSSQLKNNANKSVSKPGCKSPAFTRTTSLRTKEKPVSSTVTLKRINSMKMSAPNPKFEPKHEQLKKEPKADTLLKTSNSTATAPGSHINKKSDKNGKRRSLSAEHFDRKKGLSKTKTEQLMELSQITQSLNDIEKKSTLQPLSISPIIEETRTVTFKTPNAYSRRSRSVSSYTSTPYYRHDALASKPAGCDLQRRLEEWLQKQHKSLDSYKHLKCFGVNHVDHQNQSKDDEENKENVEIKLPKSGSYEDLKIIPEDSSCIIPISVNGNNYVDNHTVAQDALHDLHKLILDGYPHEQCEAWLGMIRQKYRELDEEPQYWECRAAIEQTRGNITSAVECLRTAIVQGAEVKSVDHSLEQLLQKFSLLNISSEQGKEDATKTDRARIVLDARNVFKSSIIQFAVQERTMKKNKKHAEAHVDKKFVATPVRRSTRLNRSAYISTPGIKLCTSLQQLDETVRNSLNFYTNSALADKFV